MALRQEQIVLVATAALLGLLVWKSGSDGARRPRARSASGPQFESHPAPDPALALPEKRASSSALGPRDLFAPPRDTQPLPPLPLEEPPLPVLTALRPPGLPGPLPRFFGSLLRADPTPVPEPGLFLSAEQDLDQQDLLAEDGVSAEEPSSAPPGRSGGSGGSSAGEDDAALTPEQRAARLQSWKRLYDWIRIDAGEPHFGRIANADRFGLAQRPKEAIEFTEVDPRTGAERFPGMKPVRYGRERVLELGLADTASNRIQTQRREFLAAMSPGRYPELLAFAQRCVELRLEARDALSVAEEMYELAARFAQGDPAPRLGLARCHEAAFEFERAYQDYLGLLEEFGHRADVHVRLAELEARFRLFPSAELRLLEAERLEPLSWRVQWSFGRFLLARDRAQEALPHLETALRSEPSDPLEREARAGIREDLARAQLALGRPAEALEAFGSALQADAQREGAHAGQLSARRLMARPSGDAPAGGDGAPEQAGFELLLASGLSALDSGRRGEARELLLQAAEVDPLRAASAWGALSWLAETSGYPDEAFRFVEQAVETDPEDAWALYQRGRVLSQRDDRAGAHESLVRALDRELDFVDALVALAALARRSQDLPSAELYLERALTLDPRRGELHALRGLGLLELGDVSAAEASLRRAQEVDAADPLAAAGLSWVAYRRGDSERAIRLFAELDDRRRTLPESDPYRRYAQAQIARIRYHESKEVWNDRFERRELRNDWSSEESAGPLATLSDGTLLLSGDFKENGRSRVWREYAAPDFLAIEALLTVRPENNARVGMFVAKERRRGAGQSEVQGIVAIGRHKDGALVVRTEDRAAADPQWEDVPPIEGAPWWPAGRPVRLRIERSGEGSEALGRILVDGVVVREGFPMRQLSGSTGAVLVGFVVDGQTGLPAALQVDDVQIVRRVVGK